MSNDRITTSVTPAELFEPTPDPWDTSYDSEVEDRPHDEMAWIPLKRGWWGDGS